MDPWAEKYPAWSPFVYAMGNSLKYVDPNGEWNVWVETIRNVQYGVVSRTSLFKATIQEFIPGGLLARRLENDPSVRQPGQLQILWSLFGGKAMESLIGSGGGLLAKVFDGVSSGASVDELVRAANLDRTGFNMLLNRGILVRRTPIWDDQCKIVGIEETDETDVLIINPAIVAEVGVKSAMAIVNQLMTQHWRREDPMLAARLLEDQRSDVSAEERKRREAARGALNPGYDASSGAPQDRTAVR